MSRSRILSNAMELYCEYIRFHLALVIRGKEVKQQHVLQHVSRSLLVHTCAANYYIAISFLFLDCRVTFLNYLV